MKNRLLKMFVILVNLLMVSLCVNACQTPSMDNDDEIVVTSYNSNSKNDDNSK